MVNKINHAKTELDQVFFPIKNERNLASVPYAEVCQLGDYPDYTSPRNKISKCRSEGEL